MAKKKMVIDSKVGRVRLIPGEHKLLVKRGGEELFTGVQAEERRRGRRRCEMDAEGGG